LKLLVNALPKTVDPESWIIVGNPRGYGKSSLVKEYGSHYQGPVLFTDFTEVTDDPMIVRTLLHSTIAPLFFDMYPLTIGAGTIFIRL